MHSPAGFSSLPVMDYAYVHEQTEATTGYFSCVPSQSLDFDAALARLEAAPMDDFLHLHLLRQIGARATEELDSLAATCRDPTDGRIVRPVLAALLAECSLLLPAHRKDGNIFFAGATKDLAAYSPAVCLRAASRPDHRVAAAWSALFRANICDHRALPRPEDVDIAPLFFPEAITDSARHMASRAGALHHWHQRLLAENPPRWERPPPQETFLRALDALLEAGLVSGPEMRHEASLSPVALLREWRVDLSVRNGALAHTLRGTARAYGRGLSLAAARASYAMEIVERASAYASVEAEPCGGGEVGQVLDRKYPLPLIRACFADLREQGRAALAPDSLPLEAPFPDVPLHWLPAQDPAGGEVLVPAQAVFLFCNLDEPSLFLAASSTGLASGNTVEEARLAALTEIVERDAEATTPYKRNRCFVLRSRDARIQSLLDDYAACGIHVQFLDLTTELGVPVYQCFVHSRDGSVARATGAGLCGPRAALAALTETPWPYSLAQGHRPRPSGAGLGGLPVRFLEDLPDYSLPSPQACCRLLENTLAEHGIPPLYVNLTRKDLDIPVVRALVPGLCLASDWDNFSLPALRLFARYWASVEV